MFALSSQKDLRSTLLLSRGVDGRVPTDENDGCVVKTSDRIKVLLCFQVMIEGTIIIASLASVARLYAEGYILSPSDLEYASNLIEMAKGQYVELRTIIGVSHSILEMIC